MTPDGPSCLLCGSPLADNAYVCMRHRCAGGLTQVLAEIPALAEQLDIAVSKQQRITRTGRPDPADILTIEDRARISQSDAEASVHIQSLPYDPGVSNVADHLRATLVSWAKLVVEDRGLPWPADTLADMSAMLLGQVEWLRHQPFGGEAVTDIRQAAWRGWAVCDQPVERVYAGPCDRKGEHGDTPCLEELYVPLGASEAECRCGLVWNVADRRSWLLESAEGMLVTAADLSRFLTVYGEPVKVDRIKKWAQRGQLQQHGRDGRGHPLYRVGEATRLLVEMTRRSA